MPDSEKPIRAFIAINLSRTIREQLETALDLLRAAGADQFVRWSRPDQIHLTLRFLGGVPPGDVPALQAALGKACAGISRFRLEVGGFGCFPNPRNPRVVWAGVQGALDSLQRLHERMAVETAGWGEIEAREFHPHLTIGRIKHATSRQARALAGMLTAAPRFTRSGWEVTTVDLMRSHLGSEGSRYSCLFSQKLPR